MQFRAARLAAAAHLTAAVAAAAATGPILEVAPTNASAPTAGLPALSLQLQPNGQPALSYSLATAFGTVPAGSPLQAYLTQAVSLHGDIFLYTNTSVKETLLNSIAYVSCDDAEAHPDSFAAQMAETAWAANISANAYAVVFYSSTSATCRLVDPGPFGSGFLGFFTMVQASVASVIETKLNTSGAMPAAIVNGVNATAAAGNGTATGGGGGDSGGGGGGTQAPSSTVAMIVLYSITGLITLCFICVVIAGAVRAHRHPEWYQAGEDAPGRARVLGRAILDSMPVIKFGDLPPVPPKDVDLELGEHPASPPPEPKTDDAERDITPQAPTPTPAPVPAPAAATATAPPSSGLQAAAAPVVSADEQTCSICVEEFRSTDDVRVLPACSHAFHPACVDPWLLNISSTCPLCRLDLQPPAEPSPATDPANTSSTSSPHSPAGSASLWYLPTAIPGVYRPVDPTALPRRSGRLSAGAWARRWSRRGMRDASPGERAAALRDLAAATAADTADTSATTERSADSESNSGSGSSSGGSSGRNSRIDDGPSGNGANPAA